MSAVTATQPLGTPTWIDLGVSDLDRAMEFYGALFGWRFEVGPAETGHYTICLLRDKRVAALSANAEGEPFWNVYLATDDCDGTAERVAAAGGKLVLGPLDIPGQGRMALVLDPLGAQFGLWQGSAHIGCELVNEPNTLVRNDLVTPTPAQAREFYPAVFDFTLDGNADLPELDFSFLRRPDGHEVGGIMGAPGTRSHWNTTFEVDDTDAAIARATAAGATVTNVEPLPYGKIATLNDPLGAELSLIARA